MQLLMELIYITVLVGFPSPAPLLFLNQWSHLYLVQYPHVYNSYGTSNQNKVTTTLTSQIYGQNRFVPEHFQKQKNSYVWNLLF